MQLGCSIGVSRWMAAGGSVAPPATNITKVAQTGNTAKNATSVSCTFSGNVTAGNLLLVGVSNWCGSNDPYLIGDFGSSGTATLGTAMLDLVDVYNYTSGSYLTSAIFSVPVTGTGSCTLTISGAPAGAWIAIGAEEITGADTSATRLAGSSKSLGSAGAADSGTAISSTSSIFFGVLNLNGYETLLTVTPDAAFSSVYVSNDASANPTISVIDRVVTSTTTDSASWTSPAGSAWQALMGVYKATGSTVSGGGSGGGSTGGSGTVAITSTSGTLSHGSTVTISGSGFGTKSTAAPVLYDLVNYPTLVNGDVVPVGGANLWPATGGNFSVYYKTTNPRGKQSVFYSNEWSTEGAKKAALDGYVVTGAKTSKKLYLSFWLYCSSDPSVGGTNASNKWFRLNSAAWGVIGEGTLVWEPTLFNVFSFDGTTNQNRWNGWGGTYPGWTRMEISVDSSVADAPAVKVWANGSLRFDFTTTPALPWVVDILGTLGFDGSNTPAVDQPTVDFGEIYADNTIARVELGNSSTYTACTHKEIQPPTAWSTGSVSVTLNHGSFSTGTAYLYVIDANGAVNSNGYAVTLV